MESPAVVEVEEDIIEFDSGEDSVEASNVSNISNISNISNVLNILNL